MRPLAIASIVCIVCTTLIEGRFGGGFRGFSMGRVGVHSYAPSPVYQPAVHPYQPAVHPYQPAPRYHLTPQANYPAYGHYYGSSRNINNQPHGFNKRQSDFGSNAMSFGAGALIGSSLHGHPNYYRQYQGNGQSAEETTVIPKDGLTTTTGLSNTTTSQWGGKIRGTEPFYPRNAVPEGTTMSTTTTTQTSPSTTPSSTIPVTTPITETTTQSTTTSSTSTSTAAPTTTSTQPTTPTVVKVTKPLTHPDQHPVEDNVFKNKKATLTRLAELKKELNEKMSSDDYVKHHNPEVIKQIKSLAAQIFWIEKYNVKKV